MNKFRYRLEKKVKQSTKEFPVGTIAFYGPTADVASKVVVAVFLKDGDEPTVLERFFSDTSDVRFDEEILEKVLSIMEAHGVKSVAMIDGVWGCPHEEGIDYPEGKSCPHCPYWAGRDRSTLERIQ